MPSSRVVNDDHVIDEDEYPTQGMSPEEVSAAVQKLLLSKRH